MRGKANEYLRYLQKQAEDSGRGRKVVKDGDWIDYVISQGQPVLLDAALAKRKYWNLEAFEQEIVGKNSI